MAFQLVYTSAPKLLQAGRTGFGTVARHPALKGTLQEEIERISQFSRVAGLDIHRTIYAHRVLNVRGEAFNVISRIRDAGSDYTGRTNHIAHHIVVSSSEAKQDLSPVDLIIQLEHSGIWRNAWEDGPKEFSADDEIKIAGFTKLIDLPATHWQPAKNAALPASGRYSESCWILHGGELNNDGTPMILWMIGESLLLAQSPWNISFSTDIQPTERVEELRWKGVCNSSPMRAVALQSVRPTIDLSDSAALTEPDGKLALMAEFGRDAQSTNSTTFQNIVYGEVDEEVSEGVKSPLIRKSGKRQAMHGDSLRFGKQIVPVPHKSQWVLKAILIAVPVIIALLIGGFFYIRSSHTYNHLIALDTSVQDPPFISGAIQEANTDWVYLFGVPPELTVVISAMTLYAAGVEDWENKNFKTALDKFKEAAKEQNNSSLFINSLIGKLRVISNQKEQEFKIIGAVERIKSGTIEAALNPRADSKISDITEIQYWNENNRSVPGLSREQVRLLTQLKALTSDRNKTSFSVFKEALKSAREGAQGSDELTKKIEAWLDKQACDYAVNVLKQPTLDAKSLPPILDSEGFIKEPEKRKALESINKVVKLINDGAKPDQDATRKSIQAALAAFGVELDQCVGINAKINELPKAEKLVQTNIITTKAPAETLVPTVIVSSLEKLIEQVGNFKTGTDTALIGPVDAWLNPANVIVSTNINIFESGESPVKIKQDRNLQTGAGCVAQFSKVPSPPENWQTATKIFLLPNEGGARDAGSPLTIAVNQPLLSWDKASLTLSLSQKGKEIRNKLKTPEGKTFEYYVKRKGEQRDPLTDSISFTSERIKHETARVKLETDLKTVYDKEGIKARYQAFYKSATNKFLNLGNLLIVNLTGSTDAEKKKKTDEKIARIKSFNDWLINEKNIKDPSKVDLSLDPANGVLIGDYIAAVFLAIEEEYCKDALNRKLSSLLSRKADPSKRLSDIDKILSEDDFKPESDPKKYKNRDNYILNLQGVFKESAQNRGELASMFSLADDWKIAASREAKVMEMDRLVKKVKDLDTLTADDFQLSAENDGLSIIFQTPRQ